MYFIVNCDNGMTALAIVTDEDGETLMFKTRAEVEEFAENNLNTFLIVKYY